MSEEQKDIIDATLCEHQDCFDGEEMPSAMEMARNLLKDGTKIVTNALQGNSTLASDEVRDARWNTCLGCEFLKNDRCTHCGCFMKVKTAFVTSTCPIGKW